MWVKNQQTSWRSCAPKDDCYIKYNDKASCEKQKSCEWADWDGGECSTTSSGEGEGPNMECGMVTDVTKAKCEGVRTRAQAPRRRARAWGRVPRQTPCVCVHTGLAPVQTVPTMYRPCTDRAVPRCWPCAGRALTVR